MTAFSSYFQAISEQNLPATVPVAEGDAEGIATVTFSPTQNAGVKEGATSDSWRDRATLAVFACRAAREGIDSQTRLHSV